MPPPNEQRPLSGAPSASSTKPGIALQRTPVETNKETTRPRHLVHWAWQLDRAANRVAIWTGRLAAWATRRAVRKDGER
jgi:hypothetical protein